MLSRRLTLGVGVALVAGALGQPAAAANLDTVTLDWAYYNPVGLALKQEGWLKPQGNRIRNL
jgi:sulfonate transport system substrate-binding protein